MEHAPGAERTYEDVVGDDVGGETLDLHSAEDVVSGIDLIGFAEAGDDCVVGDDVGLAVALEDLQDVEGFVDGFGSEKALDEVGAQNDVGFVTLGDQVAEEVEGLVVVAGLAGSGEGFDEMGVFEIWGLGLGGRSGVGDGGDSAVGDGNGGVIGKRECARM